MKRALILLAAMALPGAALAQDAWPPGQVTIVVPFGAGSTPDTIARMIGDALKQRTGKTFIIENRAGAGGNTGTNAVAKAKPDGSTMGLSILGPMAMNKVLMKSMPYNPDTDIKAVTILTEQPSALAVSNEMGVSSVKELVEKLKKDPGKYNYASIGRGSLSHLSMELVAARSGTKVVHLPQKSSPEAALAVVRNDVQMTVLPLVSVLPLAKDGKLKILAVTSAKRSAAAPDSPTFAEAGVPGVVAVAWNALIVPGATPDPVVKQINAHVTAALNDPAMKAAFAKQIMDVAPTTPEGAKAYVAEEFAKWSAIVKAAGLEPR